MSEKKNVTVPVGKSDRIGGNHKASTSTSNASGTWGDRALQVPSRFRCNGPPGALQVPFGEFTGFHYVALEFTNPEKVPRDLY